jgi:glycosyltransferase involved in cell wall biosynthesis
MPIPLILVGNRVVTNASDGSKLLKESCPDQDYIEIARRLEGKLSGYNLSEAAWYSWARWVEQRLKLDLVEALYATTQLSEYNVVLSTSEKLAIPLAILLNITDQKIPHVVIGHKLSSGRKTSLLKIWQLHKTFSHIICLCRSQVNYVVNQLGMPASAVDFVYDKVDHHFFCPTGLAEEDYILAVGQEQRDYSTLWQALSGTGLKMVVVASSLWSTRHIEDLENVGNITVLSHIPYQALRDLYARARLVVAPLFDVDYAAGVNAVLEAMAMAKPLIVSRTSGIMDYIVDQETGVYVPPGDPAALRHTILSLWEQAGERKRLGTNARQAVEEYMNLDIYAAQVEQIVRKTMAMTENTL